MPKFSVIINVFNGESYLCQAITSVLQQTLSDLELIIVDNASNDGTVDLINGFDDKRIKKIFNKKTIPLGESRNIGLKLSQGEFVSFLDCDDWWSVNRLELVYKRCKSTDFAALYTNGYKFFQKNQVTRKFYNFSQKEGDLFNQLVSRYHIYLPSLVFSRIYLDKLDYFFNPKYSMIEEAELVIRISRLGQVIYSNDCTCYWRVHEDSLSWTAQGKFSIENAQFLSDLKSWNYKELNTESIRAFEARNAYRTYLDKSKNGISCRSLLRPYIWYDKRLLVFYVLSFMPFTLTLYFLRLLGKEI